MSDDFPQESTPNPGLMVSNKFYNILKPVTSTLLPALITLYTTFATIWEWQNTDKVVLSAAAVNTFLGAVLLLSSKAYSNSDAKYDGSIDVLNTDDGHQVVQLNLPEDPSDLIAGKDVVLKIN